jgi:hypothetical protein
MAQVAEPGIRIFCIWVSTTYNAANTAVWTIKRVLRIMGSLQNEKMGAVRTHKQKNERICAHLIP